MVLGFHHYARSLKQVRNKRLGELNTMKNKEKKKKQSLVEKTNQKSNIGQTMQNQKTDCDLEKLILTKFTHTKTTIISKFLPRHLEKNHTRGGHTSQQTATYVTAFWTI